MKINNNVYDVLAWVGKIVLPAIAVLCTSLGKTWGFPYVEQVTATILAIDLFLNTLLGISTTNYYKSEAEKEVDDSYDNGEKA